MKTDKKDQFLKHFAQSLAVVSEACKKTKITRTTFYNWCNTDKEFKEKIKEIEEDQKDYVESKLIENIKNNDTTSIIFYLKTKAKDKGYTEKMQVEVETDPKDLFLNLMKQATAEMD